jgi:hypothetical protein
LSISAHAEVIDAGNQAARSLMEARIDTSPKPGSYLLAGRPSVMEDGLS